MSVIGVIAAMTVPGLKKYSQRNEFARGAQKAYFTLSEAYEQALLIYGPAYKWPENTHGNRIVSQLKVTKRGETKDSFDYVVRCSETGCDFTVDVNSLKEPNKEGKDQFKFQLTFGGVDFEQNTQKDRVEPIDDAKILHENNWKFTDSHWNG